MRIYHPELPDTPPGEVTESSWLRVWQHRGWVPVPETDIPIGEMTVDEVLDAVGADAEAARAVLHAEQQGKDRTTLKDGCRAVIESGGPEQSDDSSEEE